MHDKPTAYTTDHLLTKIKQAGGENNFELFPENIRQNIDLVNIKNVFATFSHYLTNTGK